MGKPNKGRSKEEGAAGKQHGFHHESRLVGMMSPWHCCPGRGLLRLYEATHDGF